VKYGAGGLLDLEFLVQFLVLAHPKPSFSRYTNTLSFLQSLYAEGILQPEHFTKLKEAYKIYHHALHQNLLQPNLHSQNYNSQLLEVLTVSKDLGLMQNS
jgi:[glutamine synthetase] adenylyltransferase / [glutamine synthetase]-adenylyl-L-tyrosine phosphorylase